LSERVLRLALVGGMVITLFLPNSGNSNLFYTLWYPLEVLSVIFYSTSNFALGLGLILFTLAIPILILLNVYQLASSGKRLKRSYRISLIVLCPLTWWGTLFSLRGGGWGIGLWANPVIVTAASLLEIVFIVSGRKTKLEDVGSAVE
jgi:hypothetical protein